MICDKVRRAAQEKPAAPKESKILTSTARRCATCEVWKPHADFDTVVRQVRAGFRMYLRSSCRVCLAEEARLYDRRRSERIRRERERDRAFLASYFFDRYLEFWYAGAPAERLDAFLGTPARYAGHWFSGDRTPFAADSERYIAGLQRFRLVWEQTERTEKERALAERRARFPTRVNPLKRGSEDADNV